MSQVSLESGLIFLRENRGFFIGLLSIVAIYFVRKIFTYGSRGALYPPGPPGRPFVGNALEFPTEYSHRKFSEWAQQYGDVFSLQVFNQTMIVLNTPTLMKEIFDRRSLSNSSRPKSTIINMITPNDMNMGLSHTAGENWKIMRKASNHLLSKENLRRYTDLQHAELTQMMVDIARDPKEWYMHVRRESTSYTLAVIYGKRAPIVDTEDVREFFNEHKRFNDALEIATAPPVDLFPILKYVPERFAAWKRNAKEVRRIRESLFDRLTTQVEERMKAGMGNGSFVEDVLRNAQAWGMKDRSYIEHLGGTLLEGAVTTGPAAIYLILCAAAFPDKQAKVAEELERVIGSHRVPTIEDMENLPYTTAFAQECTRFIPVANLGLPHEMNKDEIVNGFLYPKGSFVFQNTWFIFHDERYFDRPDEFLPERFLNNPHGVKPGVEDDPARRDNILFGGGRRICPGAYLARTHLDIFTAYMFWAFQIKPRLDPVTGKEVPPDMGAYDPGLTAVPYPFECRFIPRSPERLKVIQQEFSRAAEFMTPFEQELSKKEREYNAKYRDI